MQQPPQMMPSMPPSIMTTEQIQKCLDENKKLILAILENQNLGKLTECAQYQNQLQKNLMYLAAVADAQPQVSTGPPQMPPHPAMQQGGYFMQHPQAAAAAAAAAGGQQPAMFPPKVPMQYTNQHQIQDQQQQQLQPEAQAGQIGARPVGGGSISTTGAPPPSGGSKQLGSEAGPSAGSGGSKSVTQ